MDTLISARELADNLDNPGWCILDCRFSLADVKAGEAAYRHSHIPGAHYLNLESELSSAQISGKTGRHPLPDKSDWLATVQGLGLDPDIQIVIYDDAGGAMAARLWWMLRWIGHENAAVLNGSWQAWLASGCPVSSDDAPTPVPSEFDYASMPSLTTAVSADDIDTKTQLLLDARELPRFLGEIEPLDPVAGHIPGAQCSPFSENLDSKGNFLEPEQLLQKFHQAMNTEKQVVCYCGSGVTAAHNILAMKIAGLEEPALYPGSWSDWITDPDRPIAIGKED